MTVANANINLVIPMPHAPPATTRHTAIRIRRLVAALIVVAVIAAYANTFGVPFLLDDATSIVGNSSIRSLSTAFSPPAGHGETVGGRPLLNFSFAINHALGGLDPAGYHAGNLLIHAAAALLLFGFVRRTLSLPVVNARLRDAALPLAAAIALLWAVHPLQTAAVTYIAQRAESLCGFFILLTLYASVRHAAPEPGDRPEGATGSWLWFVVAVAACLAGVATKEVMVVAPVLVWLHGRVFLHRPEPSVAVPEVCRSRWLLPALFFSWLPLAWFVHGTQGRAGSAGFAAAIAPWDYALTQAGAVVRYLRLAVWPYPLVFDHGTPVVEGIGAVWLQLPFLAVLAGATVYALCRRSPAGFAGAWFFLVLAPSSSVVPVATQTIAEHRMYLSLAAIVAAVVLCAHRFLGRRVWPVLAWLVVAAGITTFARNGDYRTALALWSDTATKAPGSPRAHLNLGVELAAAGRLADALASFEEAVRLAPEDSDARNNLANTLAALGRPVDALPHFAEAVRLGPGNWRARVNYGRVLADLGRFAGAREQFAAAADLQPLGATYAALARVEVQLGHRDEAVQAWRVAARLEPGEPGHHVHLGELLLVQRQPRGAIVEFETALRLGPETAGLRARLGVAMALAGRTEEARAALERALVLDPENTLARSTLARLPPAAPR